MNVNRGPVSLLPLFRSEAQYRLVAELFTNPGMEATIGELAAAVGASHPTVSREVQRLETAGLLRTSEEGRRRLVTAVTTPPVFRPLRDLMAIVYGVPHVIRQEFEGLDAQLEIFGSRAARWWGVPGHTPSDVDVLVSGIWNRLLAGCLECTDHPEGPQIYSAGAGTPARERWTRPRIQDSPAPPSTANHGMA